MSFAIILSVLAISILMAVILCPHLSYSSPSTPTNSTGGNEIEELFTTTSNPYGLTYGEWTARWWQWAYSIPRAVHPAYDDSGRYCAEGQSGPVWFLAGSYEHPAERYCTIPAGKAILLPILNSECSYAEFPNLNAEEELRQCAKQMQDSVVHLEASIDGVAIAALQQYRLQSPLFNLTLGENNILGLPVNTTTEAVSDGNWLFLKPLSIGEHVIYFKGGLEATNNITATNNNSSEPFAGPYGWDNPVTYHITISNSSSSSSLSSSSSSTANSMAHFNQTQAEIIPVKNPIVDILANELETRINKSGGILEITSRLPQVRSAPYASSISSELNGIPRDADMPKRQVAQDILDMDKDFEVIYFLMPNGDMYLEEPYSRQENLTRSNFAFRDYYKGALNSQDTYLGDMIISASSGRPQANIAVPMYSENNGTLVGVWAGGLNLTTLSNSLQSVNLTTSGERIVYLDRYGQKIADSDSQLLSKPNATVNESFADLQAFKNAINGQTGSTTEKVNGTTMLVSYHQVKAFSNVWVVLFMELLR